MSYKKKYAKVLLESCLKLEKGQPLFISYSVMTSKFVEIVTKMAFEMGVKDIYLDVSDPYIKHDALKSLEVEELKKLPFWNKEMWNVYAKKNAAFLMLTTQFPGLMKDVDSLKMSEMAKYSYETRKDFDSLRDKASLAWCIAAVPTEEWATVLFPEEEHPVDKLWDSIFDICSIYEDNPVEIWNHKIHQLNERAEKLNAYQFQMLQYNSSNGTDFSVCLPKNHLWASGRTVLTNGKEVLVNFPTEEVFTSPDCMSAKGVLFSSKPLSYQDVIIDDFSIRFSDGKVVEAHAREGEDVLQKMISICPNSDYLGEIALVPYDSPISNRNQIFLETLYDENASCHIALGDSFPECIEGGIFMDKDYLLEEYHLNKCDSHVDFMVGTKDMSIVGITEDGRKVPIFVDGNFTEEFQ